MEQRNALLRDAKKGARLDRAMLEAFEHGMAAPGEKIILERRKMLATISDCAARKYEQISGRPGEHFHMAYECCLEGDDDLAQRIIDGLSRSRQEDMIRATTSFGVHREDIALTTYLADVDTDDAFTPDTEVIAGGAFEESKHRSAPYFDVDIDGITLK